MQIAIVGAGFTPAEADKLRRAMATFRRAGTIHKLKDDFIDGMVGNGYDARIRRALLQADRGLRRIRLSREPRRELRHPGLRLGLAQVPLPRGLLPPPCSTASRWASMPRPSSCAMRASTASRCGRPTSMPATGIARSNPARTIVARCALACARSRASPKDDVKRMVERRTEPYRDPADLWRRSGLTKRQIVALARADAFASLGLSRRDVLWAVRGFLRRQAAAARRSGRVARPRTQGRPALAHARRAGGGRLRLVLDVVALPSAGAAAAALHRARRVADRSAEDLEE